MPYKVARKGSKWFVVKADTGKVVSKPMSNSMKANAKMRAMMANEMVYNNKNMGTAGKKMMTPVKPDVSKA